MQELKNSHGKKNQYLHAVDFYWHIKNLLRIILFERNNTRDELLLHMEELHLQFQDMDEYMKCMDVAILYNQEPTLLGNPEQTNLINIP